MTAAALGIAATTASANHYLQSADPQVVGAINEIIMVLGQSCNIGNAAACNAIPLAQQEAHAMLLSGYDCQTGNAQACGFYQQNVYQLEQTYNQVATALQSGWLSQNTGGAGAGLSHADRMAQIHQWGRDRLEYGRQSQAILDANHDRFMEYLRQ